MDSDLDILQKLWDWAEKKRTTEEINNKILLGPDCVGMTSWHWAAMDGNLETLKKYGNGLKRI